MDTGTERRTPGDMVTVLLATADEAGAIPEGKEYRLVLGGGQAIPGMEELIMAADAGRHGRAPREVARGFPGRGAARQDEDRARQADRREAQGAAGAGRRFARGVGDFDSVDALKAAVKDDLEKHDAREADAEVRQKLIDDLIRRIRSRCRRAG